VLANSGWAWHLFAAPAIWVARLRSVPVVVNYHGGDAERFFKRAWPVKHWTLRAADAVVVPSGFLQQVFRNLGIDSVVISNVIDLDHFQPRATKQRAAFPHVVITRNLEPIYGIDTALRAFALIRSRLSGARLTIAGEGPHRAELERLARELRVAEAVHFIGRLRRQGMADLYADADLMLNASSVDNTPNSILEAYAARVPIVSTDVGGIPYIARDGETALLVPPRDPPAMAAAACRVLCDSELAESLVEHGMRVARVHGWNEVRVHWLRLYQSLAFPSEAAVVGGP
jgi:glycosyltransferase involved in cell wall biosynthesis